MTGNTIADQVGDDLLDKFDGENAVKPIQEIKERIDMDDTTRGFSISRIPTAAHEDFKTLSSRKFGDDYGATLAFLVDYFKHNERYRDEYEDIMDKLEDLEEEIK